MKLTAAQPNFVRRALILNFFEEEKQVSSFSAEEEFRKPGVV